MILRIIIAAVLAVSAASAGAYTVKSVVECPDIVREDADENYREMNRWWLMGYFTGRNYADDASVGDTIESDSIYSMALDYCRANPERDWDDAAIHVYDLLD